MTQSELNNLVKKSTYEVISKNKDFINRSIRSALADNSDGNKVSANDTAKAAIELCLTLTPELSAEITSQILVKLGLVVLED